MGFESFEAGVQILTTLPNLKELIVVDADLFLPRNPPNVSVPYRLTFQESGRQIHGKWKYLQSALLAEDDAVELFESREWPVFKAVNAHRVGEKMECDEEMMKRDMRNLERNEHKERFLRRWLNRILKVLRKGAPLHGRARRKFSSR